MACGRGERQISRPEEYDAVATTPAGCRMGHAGAVIGGKEDTAAAKIAIFKECGIENAVTPSDMADALLRAAAAKGVSLA